MNAILPLVTARRLADAAWRLGELDRFVGDPDIDDMIAEAVWIADAEVAEDQAPLAMIREARALLLARHDGELAARERQAAALVADEIEAGDRRPDGAVVAYDRYRGV